MAKFSELFIFKKKSKRKSGDGLSIGEYPFYTSSSRISKYTDEPDYILDDGLLFGTGGRASIHYLEGGFSSSGDCFTVTKNPEIELSTKFAYYYFIGNMHLLDEGFKGAGLKHISKVYIQDIKIPYPPLAEQQKIAAILDAADSLRQKDQQLIDHYTTLSQSLFLGMFGDPVSNPMGWERTEFGSLIVVLTDYHANGSYEVLKENVELKSENDYALMVRTTDLEHNNFDDNVVCISQHAYEYLHKSKVFGGEIIISKIGSAGKVFLMPYLNRPVSLGMNAFLLRFDNNLNNLFVYYLLTSQFGEIEIGKRIKGAVTKTIRKDALREIEIIIPPIALQIQFAERIEAIEAQKQQAQASLEKSNDLFNSLLQRAFNGELTGSKAA